MLKRSQFGLAMLLLFAAASCGGGGGAAGNGTSALNFTMTTNPGSSVQAAQVGGVWVDLGHQDYASLVAQLPAGSPPLAGMRFTPTTPPGAGFSGILRAKLDTEKGTSAIVSNRRVDVWSDTNNLITRRTSIVTGADGSFTLPLNFLGLLIFAGAQPGGDITIAAFADQSATGTGIPINFRATAQGAQGPVTFNWDFGDGNSANGAEVAHAYALPGSYNVILNAADGAGNIPPAVSTPIVISASAPPLTGVTVAVTAVAATASPLDFDYQATLTGGLAPFDFNWVFNTLNAGVDTANSTVANISYTFGAPGQYSGLLTVTDALGAVTTAPFNSNALVVPVIVAINPPGAEPGETVDVQGTGFGTQDGNDRVTLGALQCVVDQAAGGWTDTSIKIIVPAAAVNGNVVVETTSMSNAVPFAVLPASPGGPGGGQF